MGHQDTDMDVESLKKTGCRRGRCLDTCLVVSIVFLFVAVIAVAAGGVICVMELQSKLGSARPPVHFEPKKLIGGTSPPTYKMQNFAYLKATSNKLQSCTMPLNLVVYGEGTSVGSNFVFDENLNSLKPLKDGTYFIYMELNFTCTSTCSAGVLSVSVGDKLTCEVELPDRPRPGATPVSRRCWTVTQKNTQGLHAQMTVPKTGLRNWQLELKGSGLGMFLVD
ncbi:uncharacterized protein LOC117815251 [Notolabrus celidotus]|uniref:uncharacterized protein LOC117815251 n=1 Tax=Notolabrus celidotus TaxID=1203425 RepID=UPI0014907A24|nr:uncharacterized protein LOC117815251 [Notolabrus celidotus]